ncbi:MAG: 4Fe-4S dicluster domain-containing protein [Clostridiales bacterium]|nr:4Fe-4S dicluster domain-containing protein [Clostridiales bacterium]
MRNLINCACENCVGCNHCVRVCPIDEANVITSIRGKNVWKINGKKCIACGACIKVCHHGARHYEDDTELFIRDLERGVKINVVAAPAAKTNFEAAGGLGRLLAWLRSMGAQQIFDASLGADICAWAHLCYIQRNDPKPVISQHCPVVVNYLLKHREELVKHLSPIHSPMLSMAVYIRKYEKADAKIAALSPCIANAHEFEAAGFIDYNVTLNKLQELIEANKIVMPKQDSGFDRFEASLGSLQASHNSFMENVDHCIGESFRIDKAEGQCLVYKALDEYARQPETKLPTFFGAAHCHAGCHLGTGCRGGGNIFEINTVMNNLRQPTAHLGKKRHRDELFKVFDKKLRLSDFVRKHTPAPVQSIRISQEDIGEAFAWLGKFDEAAMNFNCGACGCETCFEMAERIAKDIAVPSQCMEKAKREAHWACAEDSNLLKTNLQNLEEFFQKHSVAEAKSA